MNKDFDNVLFVTDLDGTLFESEPVLSEECVRHLVKLNSNGVRITFSTARTYRTVDRILRDVPLPLPVSLMNGTMIRDVKNGKTIDVKKIPDRIADKIGKCFLDADVFPLVYRYKNDEMLTYYSKISGNNMKNFIEERAAKFNKPFIKVRNNELFLTGPDSPGDVIYYCLIVNENEGCRVLDLLKDIKDVCLTTYKDNSSDSRYIEIYSPEASKKNALLYLKKLTGADRLITFGDNFNDLPMFEVSDLSFAPIGSPGEVISSSDGTVLPPGECGVTRKIAELTGIRL